MVGANPSKRKRSVDWSAIAFVASLCLIAFLYGFAANQFDLPPKGLMRQAVSALKAVSLIDDGLPTGVTRVDRNPAPNRLVHQLDREAGKELLLVTAWPNRGACPKYSCLASVVDRSGKVLRSWPDPLDALFSDVEGFSGQVKPVNFYPIGLGMLHDGSLVATFHGHNVYPYAVGIARFDPSGKIMWKHIDGAHHWIQVGPDDRIYAPIQIRRPRKHVADNAVEFRCPDIVYDEGIRIYRPDGSVERTLMMSDILVENGYPGLIYSVRDDCDPLHINSIDIATPEISGHIPGAVSGDLLVSLREPGAIVLLDPATAKIKRLIAGRTAAQHSAKFLPDGTVLAFDNQGGSRKLGGSRIVRLNLLDDSVQTIFPTTASRPVLPFFSFDGGTVTLSPDGKRAMISSKHESRDIEIDLATGRPLWTMTHALAVKPGSGKSETQYYNAYGSYYLTGEQLRALHLQ